MGSLLRAVASLAPAVLAAALVSATGAHGATGTGTQVYVALGDSVASGYGLSGTAGSCGRAPGAYPERVRRALERRGRVRFRFLACAGATAAGRPGPGSLAGQVDRALRALGSRGGLVSITIGVNDLGWTSPLRLAQLLRAGARTFDRRLDASLRGVEAAVRAQLDRLLRRPRVDVVLTEYYDPLNRRSVLFSSRVLCPVARVCRRRARALVARLDSRLGRLAAPRRVALARVQQAFRGHEAPRPGCGTAPPGPAASWIQRGCFHPNDRGAAAIAAAVVGAARRLGR